MPIGSADRINSATCKTYISTPFYVKTPENNIKQVITKDKKLLKSFFLIAS